MLSDVVDITNYNQTGKHAVLYSFLILFFNVRHINIQGQTQGVSFITVLSNAAVTGRASRCRFFVR